LFRLAAQAIEPIADRLETFLHLGMDSAKDLHELDQRRRIEYITRPEGVDDLVT
jgi:hypothetical protein